MLHNVGSFKEGSVQSVNERWGKNAIAKGWAVPFVDGKGSINDVDKPISEEKKSVRKPKGRPKKNIQSQQAAAPLDGQG